MDKNLILEIYNDLCFIAKKYKRYGCEINLIDNYFKVTFKNYVFILKVLKKEKNIFLILKYNNIEIYEHEVIPVLFFYHMIFKAIRYNVRKLEREKIKEV